ncbi:hypothetical protein [Pedobacter antarcticus]|uniref:Uncharacterized protein n=1 Tax=Pedobacter antarcticus TaxID=34086 RepID=A0A1I2E551_9SPHI|nr:hypothetical protein [Pedobacter antarcticus]SDL70513.1 hypothetical protein SAMN04488084_102180 [Pedobacter antarcticus]SFE87789.1 hypothetical protein SAMN03003324_01627 [Pedobacter antarcticus]
MSEREFLAYCQSQVSGDLTEEDLVTMLTAWGSIKYSEGHTRAMEEMRDGQSAAD